MKQFNADSLLVRSSLLNCQVVTDPAIRFSDAPPYQSKLIVDLAAAEAFDNPNSFTGSAVISETSTEFDTRRDIVFIAAEEFEGVICLQDILTTLVEQETCRTAHDWILTARKLQVTHLIKPDLDRITVDKSTSLLTTMNKVLCDRYADIILVSGMDQEDKAADSIPAKRILGVLTVNDILLASMQQTIAYDQALIEYAFQRTR
jgi:hypothetical protein